MASPSGIIDAMFTTDGFPARWECGTGWTPALGWTHILADVAIFGAYAAIPATLAFFLSRRRDVPFPGTGWLFVAFILSCGIGHLLEAIIFYHPIYRFAGVVKVITATASWATVIALFKLMPTVLAVPAITRQNVELQTALGHKEREARSLERMRDQVDTRQAELVGQSRQLQSALVSARVVGLQWEAANGRILWSVGIPQALPAAARGEHLTERWDQLLDGPALDRLHAAERLAMQGGGLLEITLPLRPGADDGGHAEAATQMTVVARLESGLPNNPPTFTGMFRIVSTGTG